MGRISNNQYHAPPRHPLVFPLASAGRYRRGGNSPARNCHYLSPPTKRLEFDVTNAVKDWSSGVPNNGLVIRATNELDLGRDTRFSSSANIDNSTHAFVLVRCSDGTYKQLQKLPPLLVASVLMKLIFFCVTFFSQD